MTFRTMNPLAGFGWALAAIALGPACTPQDVAGIIHDGAGGDSQGNGAASGANAGGRVEGNGGSATAAPAGSGGGVNASGGLAAATGGSSGAGAVGATSGASPAGAAGGAAAAGGTTAAGGMTAASGGSAGAVGAAAGASSGNSGGLSTLAWMPAKDMGPDATTGEIECHSLEVAITQSEMVLVAYSTTKMTNATSNEGTWAFRYRADENAFDAPAKLSAEGTSLNGRVAASDAGDAIVAWNGDDVLQVRRFSAAGKWPNGWTDAETMARSAEAGDIPMLTGLAMSPAGHAVISWGLYNSSGAYVRVFETGHGWEAVRTIPPSAAGKGMLVGAIDVSGGVHTVATTMAGNILATPYDYDLASHTGAFGSTTRLFGPEGNLEAQVIDITVDGAGNVFVPVRYAEWPPKPATNQTLVARYTREGAASAVTTLNALPGAPGVKLAVSRNGNAAALFGQCNPPAACALRARSFVGGTWQPELEVAPPGKAYTDDNGSFAIALNDEGRAVAVWSRVDSGEGSVWASELDPSLGWGAPHVIDRGGVAAARYLSVALTNAGRGLAVWAHGELGVVDSTFLRESIRVAAFAPE